MYVDCGPKSFQTFRSPHETRTSRCLLSTWLVDLLTEGFIETLALSSAFPFHFLNPLPVLSYSVLPTPIDTYAAKKGKGVFISPNCVNLIRIKKS